MGLRCCRRHVQSRTDLAVAQALRDIQEHLSLTRGEIGEPRRRGCRDRCARVCAQESTQQRRGEHDIAARNRVHGGQKFGRQGILQQKTARTGQHSRVHVLVCVVPAGAIEPAYADLATLNDPALQGQWWILGLALISCSFNYLLGEELLFRGVLLPQMAGVFGRWDWVANTVLFGLYHVHKFWYWPSLIIGSFGIAWATKRYRSMWMGVIVHGVEATFVLVVVIGVLTGLAG